MISEHRVEIDAPPTTVWQVYANVVRWPDWTASVQSVGAPDGPGLAVGAQFSIKQPRLPKVTWVVTAIEPGRSWTWEHRSPGARSIASHEVTPLPDGRTLVRQRIEQRGPIGAMIGIAISRMTKRYLELEARGLKARSEEIRPDNGARRSS